jgi:hypothetical protein
VIIRLASESLPVLELLDRYSPEYTCMLAAFTKAEPLEEAVLGGTLPGLHITLEVIKDQGKYVKGEEFKYPLIPGFQVPHCFGLPNPQVPFPGVKFPKGYENYDGAVTNATPSAMRSAYTGPVAGSAPESQILGVLAADKFGNNPDNVPEVTKLLMAPLVRGTTVTVQ